MGGDHSTAPARAKWHAVMSCVRNCTGGSAIEWSVVTRKMCHFGTAVDSFVVYEINILDIKNSWIVHFFLPPSSATITNLHSKLQNVYVILRWAPRVLDTPASFMKFTTNLLSAAIKDAVFVASAQRRRDKVP